MSKSRRDKLLALLTDEWPEVRPLVHRYRKLYGYLPYSIAYLELSYREETEQRDDYDEERQRPVRLFRRKPRQEQES